MENEKRKVGDYTVLCAVNIGSREIILAENEQDSNGERFLCCYGERNDIFEKFTECAVGDDYIDAALFFAERIKQDAERFREEVEKLDIGIWPTLSQRSSGNSSILLFCKPMRQSWNRWRSAALWGVRPLATNSKPEKRLPNRQRQSGLRRKSPAAVQSVDLGPCWPEAERRREPCHANGRAMTRPAITTENCWAAVPKRTATPIAIAAETYGLQGAVSLRVSQNVFGVVFALAFCVIFYWFMPKKKESEVTVHAE